MKRFTLVNLLGFGLTLLSTACATTGAMTPTGAALVNMTRDSVIATSNPGEKQGHACTMNILGLAAFGDASIEAAKKDGNIAQVASVDRDIFNILFVYGRNCTYVTGR